MRVQGEPTIFVLWHNRLFVAAEMVRRFRGGHPIYCLISASKDGAWLAALFHSVGVRTVRGSSSRLGREAAGELLEALDAGYDVGITPDGPRGPSYEMKPGMLVVAKRARSRVVLMGIDFTSSWRLPSWDGFYIPKPFSVINMRFLLVSPGEIAGRDESALELGARLAGINPDRTPAPVRKRG